ncbi:MAG TPA: DNA methyltransferase [Vicinamibacterales bacterium]|nr:DNA methyltransferase [Vicinamibacterales bacterium]
MKKAKAALDAAKDTSRAEGEVYDHLYRFFERYYEGGDFLSRRYYARETAGKAAPYAVPYDGSEVYLHWANKDQYYIKTSEYFTNFTFDLAKAPEVQAAAATLFTGGRPHSLRVHFRIVAATEGEHGNVKASEATRRYFILHAADPVGFENGELVCRFEYRPDPEKTGQDARWQATRNEQAVTGILEALGKLTDAAAREYLGALKTPAPTEKQKDRPLLARYVNRYTARNTTDYFIHKDLRSFLKRELDFYIKNEVMRLDDIESADAPAVESYMEQIRCLRRIAGRIIDFLAQLEDFQKKLWLKKKFVVETRWCVTIGTILAIQDAKLRDALLDAIVGCEAQWQEWESLHHLSELQSKGGDSGGLFNQRLMLPSVEFLKAHPSLMIDMRYVSAELWQRLLNSVGDVQEETDALLIHGENFQSLALLSSTHERWAHAVYIDPPYNTAATPILYKNDYPDASWLTLLQNRLVLSRRLQADSSAMCVAIDDTELDVLSVLLRHTLQDMDLFRVVVNHYPGSGTGRSNVTRTHEYGLFLVPKGLDLLRGEPVEAGERERNFRRSGTGENNYRIGRPNSFYAVLVDERTLRVMGAEAPPQGSDYPTEKTVEGYRRVYPIGEDGSERVWTLSYEGALDAIKAGHLKCTANFVINRLYFDDVRRNLLPSVWVDTKFSAVSYGTNLLKDLFGSNDSFSYPKSVHTVAFAVGSATHANLRAGVLDYFAGSGTTGHAVVNLNREDGGRRKFILVEMGDYFETVLLPRLKKVTFTPEWKDGRPKRLPTAEEVERGPRIFKVLRLESYEDALNNLELKDDPDRRRLLEQNPGLRTDYMLHYMLDVETRGSASLLNIDAFHDPTAYKLKVKKPGSDEYEWKNVDLIETFNYLIGLRVEHYAAPQTFAAEFEREQDPDLPAGQLGRLRIKGRLRQAPETAGGKWWFRQVEGWVPRNPATPNDGQREKVLVVWRKLAASIEKGPEGLEQDNAVLDEWFRKHQINPRESYDYDVIYVNGSNNLPNLRLENENWRVRLIEEDFHRLMWETDEA